MREYFLYKLTFPNNKVYIGQTVNFAARMNGHKNDSFNPNRLSRNCQVNNAIRKYGWESVKREIISICNQCEIDELERKYIKLYKSTDRNYGYNREAGGNAKKTVSLESRKLISNARKGKRQWSKPVLQIDLKTNQVLKRWNSVKDIGRALNISTSNISTMCNNKPKVCYQNGKKYFCIPKSVSGFKWAFTNKILTFA